MDRLKDKDRIEPLVRSLSRFSDKALLILSGKSDVSAKAKIIGPALIFERLWIMRKELDRRLDNTGYHFEWADIKQDLRSLSEVTIEEIGKRLAVRSRSEGICGKVFQSVGVAMPATIREL
ncbi:MAG: hypothetical protein OMM_07081 [Candidatus Magnetoglobus multicellularis str. Araruama]|uniref:Uncharacterized protein n=1 Tax=Candidatus Magnetoglobus multicellularis str. Araruama TaxID=890399 RepID=A0A1V1PEM1_9BACT|nr:MAG: hypothetical protein OMM_07081 [Candidatus Magnetoglobus multicellularis str. Araruama]